MRLGLNVVLTVLLGLAFTSAAFADLEGARKYVDEATERVKGGDFDAAKTKLELAEAELEGVAADAAAPVKQQIEALKKQITAAAGAEDKQRLVREIESAMKNMDNLMENQSFSRADEIAAGLETDIKNNKDLLGEEGEAMLKKLATVRKVAGRKMLDDTIDRAEARVKSLEEDWPEKKKDMADDNDIQLQNSARSAYQSIESTRSYLKGLPQDNEKVKAMNDRINKIESELTAIVGAGEVTEYARRMKDYWTTYKEYFEGWEKESDTPPTFAEFMSKSGGDMSLLNIPKTAGLIEYTYRFNKQYAEDQQFKDMQSRPEIKPILDEVKANFEKARARALKFATAVVEDMEKQPVTPDVVGAASRLGGGGSRGTLHQVLGDDAPELAALVARTNEVSKKFEAGQKAADEALNKTYKDLIAASEKAWPDMKAKFSTESGFDPNKHTEWKGKLVEITTDNLMGWRFKPGDFPFATTLNGIPLACRMEPDVAKAWDEVSKKVKHTVGNHDEDGKWNIIARVEGTTGQMMAKKTSEGTVRVGNEDVRVTEDYAEAVTAPILTIVAARCGPLAVATGAGVVTETGKVETPTGSSSGTSSSGALASTGSTLVAWMWRFFLLIVGLAAAAAALMKANFAPLANVPQAGQVQSKVGGENLALAGLVCALAGFMFLMRGFVLYGMFTNLAIIAAGLYAGMDWLVARNIVKPELAAKLKPFGVPIGLVCAALVIVSVLLSLIGLNLVVV